MSVAAAEIVGNRITDSVWSKCRFLTCSVLPVRQACNLSCPFCFSKSSISALRGENVSWDSIDLDQYYAYARERGATRLVITGGGEPLLRPEVTLSLIQKGRRWFGELEFVTNGSYLQPALSGLLRDAGLSYLCYSRHHDDDTICRSLMGGSAPLLKDFFAAAKDIRVRATCVMARGYVDSAEAVDRYVQVL